VSLNLTSKGFWVTTTILALGGLSLVAQAQTSASPFATKKKKQAWETEQSVPAPAPAPQTYIPSTSTGYTSQDGTYSYPVSPEQAAPHSYSAPAYQAPAYEAYEAAPSYQTPSYEAPTSQPYDAQVYDLPAQTYTPDYIEPSADDGSYYPGRADKGAGKMFPGGQYNPGPGVEDYEGVKPSGPAYGSGYGGMPAPDPQAGPIGPNAPRSWKDRFGLGNLATKVFGYLKIGAAAVQRDDWDAEFIADGSISAEVSAITEGGLEYGIGGELRGQYDKFRRGFGGRVGDCPPTVAGCPSVTIAGVPTALRGHSSQFYTAGVSDDEDFEVQLEGAYLFLRSSYGDVTVGRDDGAAYLFSLGAPTLMAVNASNSPVDYTGLDSVKTVNDASGFSEKITYTSPRFLGDSVGVGVQIGASYALNARACGVDYCANRDRNLDTGTLAPDLEDVFEVGLSLDRTFANGMKVEATGTYATASEQSGLAVFDDLKAYNFGFQVSYDDWRIGGSYLDSNNGLQNGDYMAYDFGVTWKPAQWGVSASYGHAEDDNALVESDQFVVGGIYEFDKFTLGAGVQYIDRNVPLAAGGTLGTVSEDATAVFIEGGFKF